MWRSAKDPKPGHRFTEAAVEYEYARACNFVDGGIAHVGAMGLCLRNGTAHNVIEGNRIWDLGGGGIGAGYANVAYGYLEAAPPPERNEYVNYRIANNYVHHCGMVDYGAVGICLFSSQDSVVAHNLIHDTAYFGIGVAGSQDPKVPFARNNTIEYNHIYNAMQVTVDGAGLYVTFAQADRGCLIRGNLLHDIVPNRFNSRAVGPYSATGIYLDGSNSGCSYENNVVYQATSALFVNGGGQVTWRDNLFQKSGTPPREFLEAMAGPCRACASLPARAAGNRAAHLQLLFADGPQSGHQRVGRLPVRPSASGHGNNHGVSPGRKRGRVGAAQTARPGCVVVVHLQGMAGRV